eukprot:CAMPEP_0118665914 /NCGR_PEP_ID=MMETSP0785-20121206/18907_1 /TAXON_ID=91992 /ORGANISM="Bolidomonas pacifica, Strain CCMP 1866" /LENGTH=61 /DNA_ID=CAMNT_0006560133 /DNA_START=75 /DNA_END=256 /DNA_ORIENTATION=-
MSIKFNPFHCEVPTCTVLYDDLDWTDGMRERMRRDIVKGGRLEIGEVLPPPTGKSEVFKWG